MPSMPLVQLIYASRPVQPPSSRDLMKILDTSRSRNAKDGVTGLLCFTGRLFLQMLEGDRDTVCETFYRILRDERHAAVRLLAYAYPAERWFPRWTMGFAGTDEIPADVVNRHAGGGSLDRLAEDGPAAAAFLKDIAAGLPEG